MSKVLVEFLLDKTQSVVSSDYVRNFSGVVEDDKVYQVYWAGDARTKGGFYDAKVLYMAESKDAGYSEVQRFYKDQVIFITGVTGFLGKVLTEKLLWSCGGIKQIYLLIHSKKGRIAQKGWHYS